MLEGCAALVHSGVFVLIITPQRPNKKDFCSIYLIDPGFPPTLSASLDTCLPAPPQLLLFLNFLLFLSVL